MKKTLLMAVHILNLAGCKVGTEVTSNTDKAVVTFQLSQNFDESTVLWNFDSQKVDETSKEKLTCWYLLELTKSELAKENIQNMNPRQKTAWLLRNASTSLTKYGVTLSNVRYQFSLKNGNSHANIESQDFIQDANWLVMRPFPDDSKRGKAVLQIQKSNDDHSIGPRQMNSNFDLTLLVEALSVTEGNFEVSCPSPNQSAETGSFWPQLNSQLEDTSKILYGSVNKQ